VLSYAIAAVTYATSWHFHRQVRRAEFSTGDARFIADSSRRVDSPFEVCRK
jgi:hypothetical protein